MLKLKIILDIHLFLFEIVILPKKDFFNIIYNLEEILQHSDFVYGYKTQMQ